MGVVGDIRDAMFGPIKKEQAMNDAEFDRALGAWEDGKLNAHLAEEERWENACERAEAVVQDMKVSELLDMSPAHVVKEIEEIIETMNEHVAQLIIDGEV